MPTTTSSSNPSSKTSPTAISPDAYGQAYFESGNYVNYKEREPRYQRLARDIDGLLRMLCLTPDPILDYGCGPGYLAAALQKLGHSVIGCDISEWARQECLKRGVKAASEPEACEVLLALDVFEHMETRDIDRVLDVAAPRILIARIPVGLDSDRAFHLEISRNDPTHINCKTAKQWDGFFYRRGFSILFDLDLPNLYSSPGVFSFIAFKV